MIKEILDEIAAISGKNDKRSKLKEHADNELLKEVLYKANSRRVKFWIKQIPEYECVGEPSIDLQEALNSLDKLSNREFTGNHASEWLQSILQSLSEDNANVLERVIKKDLKIGMDSGINDAIPNLIEETPYMGAKSFSVKGAQKLFKTGEDIYSQVKMDGTYRNAIIMNGEVELISRQGEVSVLEGAPFMEELSNYPDCVLNGELTIDGFERYEANGMVSSIMDILKKAEERGEKVTAKKIAAFEKKHGSFEEAISKMRYTVWDMITLDEYFNKKSDTPYNERFSKLQDRLVDMDSKMVSSVETKIVKTYAEAMEHFLETQEQGLEGTIIKSSTGGWKDGKPVYQLKLKNEITLDLKIVGFQYGKEGTKNENVISTLYVESECGLLKTNPSGMKEKEMKFITENQDNLMDTVVEVRCCGLSQDSEGNWSTLHPSVVELRGDKNVANTLEECREIHNASINLS